jgi:hypothetical protein
MPLTLRPTGLSSPAYRDWLDYVIVEDGRDVGRLSMRTGIVAPSCGGSGRSRATARRLGIRAGTCGDPAVLLVCTPAEVLGGFILRNLPPLYTSTWFHPARSRISRARYCSTLASCKD